MTGAEASRNRRIQRVEKYNQDPRRCKHCSNILPYEKRHNIFCDRSCAISTNNIGVRRHCKPRPKCLLCGKKVKESNRTFCSIKCHNDYKYTTYIESWKRGEEDGLTGKHQHSMSYYLKRYFFETRGRKCELCGWNKTNKSTGNIPVTLHHIDGDYTNNSEDNIQILCPNCHSLTDTYGSLNRGNGRENRRIRVQVPIPA